MKNIVLILLLSISLFSCFVPSYKMMDLSVKQADSIWLNGKELVKLNENGLEIIVSYNKTLQGISSFDLSITNNTSKPILIIPEQIYCVTSNRLNEVNTIYAFNPEKVLKNYDVKAEKLYAMNKSDKRSEMIFSIFDLVIDCSAKTEEELEQNRIDREEREKAYKKNQQSYLENINRLNEERNKLEMEALRKTTLFPEQKLSGKIFLNISKSTTNLVLHFPIENRKMEVEYENIK